MAVKDHIKKDRTTIYEVARVAGVSLATVSRVMNNSNTVTEETKKKVQIAISQLGYRPSAVARSLATSSSTNIGIMIPTTGYSYISNMLDGMISVAKIYGYITSIFFTNRTKEDTATMIDSLIRSHVDGAVIYDDELGTDEIKSILSYNVPLIIVGHDMSSINLGSILLGYKDPVCKVVNQFIDSDSDKDLYILDIINEGKLIDEIQNNIISYAEGKKKVEKIKLNDSYNFVYDYMKNYFKDHKRGYFVVPRDSLGCAVINAAIENGLNIPEDVEVLSIIGNKYSYIVRPMMSSFSLDMFKVGSVAVRMLTKLLDGSNEQTSVYKLDATFNKRESTK